MNYAEILVHREDREVIQQLNLYSQDIFSKDELAANMTSDINRVEFVRWAGLSAKTACGRI